MNPDEPLNFSSNEDRFVCDLLLLRATRSAQKSVDPQTTRRSRSVWLWQNSDTKLMRNRTDRTDRTDRTPGLQMLPIFIFSLNRRWLLGTTKAEALTDAAASASPMLQLAVKAKHCHGFQCVAKCSQQTCGRINGTLRSLRRCFVSNVVGRNINCQIWLAEILQFDWTVSTGKAGKFPVTSVYQFGSDEALHAAPLPPKAEGQEMTFCDHQTGLFSII